MTVQETTPEVVMMNPVPAEGFVRVTQIVGDKKKGVWPPIVPVSKSAWWAGCASGKYPAPLKLSGGITVWRVEDIRAM